MQSFVKFKFIRLFNHIIQLQFIQEQSRQTLPPGLKLFYDHRAFQCGFSLLPIIFVLLLYKRRQDGETKPAPQAKHTHSTINFQTFSSLLRQRSAGPENHKASPA